MIKTKKMRRKKKGREMWLRMMILIREVMRMKERKRSGRKRNILIELVKIIVILMVRKRGS